MSEVRQVKPIVIDTSRSPIYVVRFRGKATPDEYQRYLREVEVLLRQPFTIKRIVINDASEWALSTPNERRMQADWVRAHERELRATVDALGFVFRSGLMRGALRAVFWLQPLPVPHELFPTLDDAMVWARGRLASQPSSQAVV